MNDISEISKVGSNVSMGHFVVISGRIGARAIVLLGITINEYTLVAADCIVTKDVEVGKIVLVIHIKSWEMCQRINC